MIRRRKLALPLALPLALVVFLGACKAGPSAFDRKAPADSVTVRSGPEDTADASSLPEVPATARPDAADTQDAAAVRSDTLPRTSGADTDSLMATDSTTTGAGQAARPAGLDPDAPRFKRPDHVRGIYLNAWTSGSTRRVEELTALAGRTEVNSFVIDIKDASGYVSHPSAVPMAKQIGATDEVRIRDLPRLLRRLHDEGIYPIARIVIVRDPLLTTARPDLAVHDTTGNVFEDTKGLVWVNPYNHEVWDYEIALAREVARMGFPEIQWDYIRFPDIPAEEKAVVVYPGADDRPKAQVIGDFLRYSREQLADLGVKVTADVFGVTTSAMRDVGIGQVWESFIGAVDVAQPMVYPSHYWKGSFGYDTPNAYPYEVIRRALGDALRRSAEVPGAGTVRPWLQDFSLGKPPYGPAEVRAEIQATYDSGIKEWILWNPGSHYTEEALEPQGGFTTEPDILVASKVVPVSKRWEFVDSADGQDLPANTDSAGARPDTGVVADTTLVAPAARDTLGPHPSKRRPPRSPGAVASATGRRRIR